MSKKNWLLVFIVVIVLIVVGMLLFQRKKDDDNYHTIESSDEMKNFNVEIIKNSFTNKNYLISPYSIEIALNMLREGSRGNTKAELDKVLGNKKVSLLNFKNNLYIANALFVKKYYQKDVLNSYYQNLKKNYQAEILFDEFKTPDVINNWVKEKTKGMIPKILDNISSEFVLGLANAISLDVKWQQEFDCNNTREEAFTKINGNKINVEMMHSTYKTEEYKYIKTNDVEGIILPYENTNDDTRLEFIAIMPNNIHDFIEKLDNETLNNIGSDFISASDKVRVSLALPRFTYTDEISDLIDVLNKIGIIDTFTPSADLSGIIPKDKTHLYVDTAIHKTKIELSEKGTKAAAVTYFGIKNTAILEDEYRIVDINFNQPFIYMIRDNKEKHIIFFGIVYEPNLWKASTCQ